jgi:Carboxypeptidase regulatory-like domain
MKMSPRFLVIPTILAGLSVASAADVTGKVTLKGTPPPEKENAAISADANCSKFHTGPVKTQFYVVSPDGGLKDVVVKVTNVTGKSTGESAAPAVLDQKGCEYSPYILAIQTNQKLLVKNSDPTLHNVHPTPTAPGNKETNKAQMGGAPDLTFTFPTAEEFLRFKCDVHPWMFGYVTVVDNPYFAVTDKDGNFKISNLPPGKYKIEASHRKAGKSEQEVEVKDSGAKADFTLEVK